MTDQQPVEATPVEEAPVDVTVDQVTPPSTPVVTLDPAVDYNAEANNAVVSYYVVIGMDVDGTRYEAGDSIELTAAEAEELKTAGAIIVPPLPGPQSAVDPIPAPAPEVVYPEAAPVEPTVIEGQEG